MIRRILAGFNKSSYGKDPVIVGEDVFEWKTNDVSSQERFIIERLKGLGEKFWLMILTRQIKPYFEFLGEICPMKFSGYSHHRDCSSDCFSVDIHCSNNPSSATIIYKLVNFAPEGDPTIEIKRVISWDPRETDGLMCVDAEIIAWEEIIEV